MKIEKLTHDQRRQYQTTSMYTVLLPCLPSPLYTLNLLSHSQSPDDLFDGGTTSVTEDNLFTLKKESDEVENPDEDPIRHNTLTNLSLPVPNMKSPPPPPPQQVQPGNSPLKITIQSSHEDVFNWLNQNNFSSIVNCFQYYNGLDLLRLTLTDIRQICRGDDAISIRLYNQLKETIIRPLKILYIKIGNTDAYSAIYLHTLTRQELGEKLLQFVEQPYRESFELILELHEMKIKIDKDEVVKHTLPNEGQFYLKIFPYQILLCSLNS